jgi:heptosyltransferase I
MQIFRNIIRSVVDSLIALEALFIKLDTHDQRRILIMRKDGLGDCIIFLPMLKTYREYYTDAEITLIFPTLFQSLSPLLKDLDHVLWFDHGKFARSFLYRRNFLLNLRRRGYNVAIYPVFTREPIGDFMMTMTRAKEIYGFADQGETPYTDPVKAPEDISEEIDRNIFFTEKVTSLHPLISFPTIDTNLLTKDAAESIQKEHNLLDKKFVIIFPGSGATYKIWQHHKFASIIEYIASKGLTPVIAGGAKEEKLAKDIATHLPLATLNKTIILSGQTDLPALAHLLSKSLFYFGSDTGILHLAVAVGTPAIAIVGNGSIGRFFPYGDLSMNRAIFDPSFKPTGNWTGLRKLREGEIHPSIKNIPVESATKEIDSMIESLNKT